VTEKKIGILGGTFDPVHFGHLQLAKAALNECSLEKIIFIPAADPPHKKHLNISSFHHRLAMLEIVCSSQNNFSVSHIEHDLPKPSYTIDTLKYLQKKHPDSQLFFIIGGDSLLDFPEWKSYQDIFKRVHVVIANRKGLQIALLKDVLRDLGFTQVENRWKGIYGMKDVLFLQTVPDPYSSSIIREMFIKNEIPRQYLLEKVINYIQDHNLYRTCEMEK